MSFTSSKKYGEIISELMGVKNCVQIYHWQTYGYARHKASGKYYENLDKKIDRFVETLLKGGDRFVMPEKTYCRNMTDEQANDMLNKFTEYLNNLGNELKNRPDLLNIRDEILGDTNQTLFLFSLK